MSFILSQQNYRFLVGVLERRIYYIDEHVESLKDGMYPELSNALEKDKIKIEHIILEVKKNIT